MWKKIDRKDEEVVNPFLGRGRPSLKVKGGWKRKSLRIWAFFGGWREGSRTRSVTGQDSRILACALQPCSQTRGSSAQVPVEQTERHPVPSEKARAGRRRRFTHGTCLSVNVLPDRERHQVKGIPLWLRTDGPRLPITQAPQPMGRLQFLKGPNDIADTDPGNRLATSRFPAEPPAGSVPARCSSRQGSFSGTRKST